MANQQLVDYIKSQLSVGVTKQDLQKAITAAGWSMQDSNEAFLAAEGKTPEPPKTPAPPLQPQPTTIQAPVRPAAMQPRTPVVDVPPRSKTWLWVTVALVILIIAAIAAYLFVPAVQMIVGYYLGTAPTTQVPAPTTDTTTVQTQPVVPPSDNTTSTSSSTTPTTTDTTASTSLETQTQGI